MQPVPLTFASLFPTAGNRPALVAAQEMVAALATGRESPHNPLVLYGPPGCGKTCLATALVTAAREQRSDLQVSWLTAGAPPAVVVERASPATVLPSAEDNLFAQLRQARQSELVVLEDLHQLPLAAAEAVVQLLDHLLARQRPVVITAQNGPGLLRLRGQRAPARLSSRLATGLAVRLSPPDARERRLFLERQLQERGLRLAPEVLSWLTEHLRGSLRQLQGAVTQLEALAGLGLLNLETVRNHFQTPGHTSPLTMEQIARWVGRYFQVAPEALASRRRCRQLLWPRQVSMYLARQLTGLSLAQIGAYFGGRDHATVRHACRKIATALEHDLHLSCAIRQLHAELA